MIKRIYLIGILLMWICVSAIYAQKASKYRVYLSDKNETTYRLDQPETFLSQRAIDRRVRQQLPIDSTDLPVNATYLNIKKISVF